MVPRNNSSINHFLFKETVAGQVVNLYKVHFPDMGEKGFYWQITSIEAFTNHWKRKVAACHQKGTLGNNHLFFSMRPSDIVLDQQAELGEVRRFLQSNLLLKEFQDVWSFYNAIGWNYRTKRFETQF